MRGEGREGAMEGGGREREPREKEPREGERGGGGERVWQAPLATLFRPSIAGGCDGGGRAACAHLLV